MADESEGQLKPGTILGDRYEVVEVLGRGGMGVVYRVRHQLLDREFALKVLAPDSTSRSSALTRFDREIRVLGMLSDSRIVSATDRGVTPEGSPYLVMELLTGRNLDQARQETKPFPIARAVRIMAQVCRGLAVAHERNVIHRDLKPANIFLVDDGGGEELVKILDFGVAKLLNDAQNDVTRTNTAVGTPLYMSPEQARSQAVDARTDLYAVGAILYELLAGEPPHPGDSPAEAFAHLLNHPYKPLPLLRPEVPPGLVGLIGQALAREPEGRPESARQFGVRLRELASLGQFSTPVASKVATVTADAAPAPVTAASDAPSSLNTGAARTSVFHLLPSALRSAGPLRNLAVAAAVAVALLLAFIRARSPAVALSPLGASTAAANAGATLAQLPASPASKPPEAAAAPTSNLAPSSSVAPAPSVPAPTKRSSERSAIGRTPSPRPPMSAGRAAPSVPAVGSGTPPAPAQGHAPHLPADSVDEQ